MRKRNFQKSHPRSQKKFHAIHELFLSWHNLCTSNPNANCETLCNGKVHAMKHTVCQPRMFSILYSSSRSPRSPPGQTWSECRSLPLSASLPFSPLEWMSSCVVDPATPPQCDFVCPNHGPPTTNRITFKTIHIVHKATSQCIL